MLFKMEFMMRILFDSKKLYYKAPFGCLRQNEMCKLRIEIPKHCKTLSVKIKIFREDGFELWIPMEREKEKDKYECYMAEFSLYAKGLYFYLFNVNTEEGTFDLYKEENDTNIGKGDFWQITCFDKDYDTPECFKGRTIYQIFPDRFFKYKECDTSDKLAPFVMHKSFDEIPVFMPNKDGKIINNDFYGGNLKGIIKKIPYLKDLGVGAIYLNPIFYAFSNHRYDTADYKRIDPLLGTNEDFASLCKNAHENGIKIILDGVFSHTGSNSIYFDKENVFGNGAYNNANSPYRNWFMFGKNPDEYTSWWGIETLPCVDELNKEYMDYIILSDDSVIAHWLRLGADGFRLDVADELPDEFIMAFKKRLKEINPDAILIGEVWEDASNKISYGKRRKYFSQSELDSVMNYPFRTAIIDFVKRKISGFEFSNRIMTIAENYPMPVLQCVMNSLSTHDTCRILTELADTQTPENKEKRAVHKLNDDERKLALVREKMAVFLQFMLPGSPCIYYGDEIGMEGYEDPLNRGFFKWSDIECELREFYMEISRLKNSIKALKLGNIEFLEVSDDGFSFARCFKDERVVVKIGLSKNIETKNEIFSFAEIGLSGALYVEKQE